MGYLGASLIGKAIGLLTTPFFTRLVSEEDYGILTLYMTVLGAISVICSAFSTGGAIYRGFSRFEEKQSNFLRSALVVSLCFSLLICILFFTFWDYIGIPGVFFLPLVLQILCDSVIAISMAKARYKYRYLEVMIVGILSSAVPAILSIVILGRYGSAFGVRIYLLLFISLIIAVVQLLRILRSPGKVERKMLKYMLTAGIPLLPHTLSVALSGQADKLFVTRIMGAPSLAKYSVVHSLGIALQFVVTSLGSALGPWIIRRLDKGEKERICPVVTMLFALFSALSLGLCSVAPEAMRLLAPEKYLEALPALFPIAISTPISLVSYVTTVSLVHTGHGRYTAVISGMNLAMCVILNYTLISAFGYFGAGLALLLSQLLSALLGFMFLRLAGLSDIIAPMKIGGYLAFTILVGLATNLLYGQATIRWVLIIIPTLWGIIQLLKCKDLVMEAK